MDSNANLSERIEKKVLRMEKNRNKNQKTSNISNENKTHRKDKTKNTSNKENIVNKNIHENNNKQDVSMNHIYI